jgi:hypothetical protein
VAVPGVAHGGVLGDVAPEDAGVHLAAVATVPMFARMCTRTCVPIPDGIITTRRPGTNSVDRH